MDIYCPKKKCGEPWDNDYLHDVAEEKNLTYKEVLHQFQSTGCVALGSQCSDNGDAGANRAAMMDAMYDLMGDDIDGAAAMMDDAEYFGLI
jgi:hypothetical protein